MVPGANSLAAITPTASRPEIGDFTCINHCAASSANCSPARRVCPARAQRLSRSRLGRSWSGAGTSTDPAALVTGCQAGPAAGTLVSALFDESSPGAPQLLSTSAPITELAQRTHLGLITARTPQSPG